MTTPIAIRKKYEEFPSLREYDALGVPYVLFDGPWNGPLWTGHCMMLSLRDGYGDEGFAHELFHYLAASEEQRLFPDFALGRQVNGDMRQFTSSSTKFLYDHDRNGMRGTQPGRRNNGWGEQTIALQTASRQETAACNAMWLYPALIARTAQWDDPEPPVDLGAAHDFAGMEYPGSNEFRIDRIAKRVLPIVKAIAPHVHAQQVVNYLTALNAHGTKTRFDRGFW